MSAAAQAGASNLGDLEAAADFTERSAPKFDQVAEVPIYPSRRHRWGHGTTVHTTPQEEQLTPEYSHVRGPESPQSTHISNKRPYDVEVEDDSPDVLSVRSSDSPTSADTWVKRPRFGKIPDFRTAKNGMKSTLELKLRKFGNRNSYEVVAPEPGMEFDSLPEAFDIFNLYSWEVGFGIRYGASRRNKAGSMTMQEILCGCAGHRGTIRPSQWHVAKP